MTSLKSHEKKNILLLGERLRENPTTILLSIPVFSFGLLYYFLIADKEGVAGSLGHCGITFKNYYRHYWDNQLFLKIAYFLFNKSAVYASGEGKVSTIIHAGQIALLLQDLKSAENKMREALKEVDEEKVETGIEGYVFSHLATLELAKKDLNKARVYLEKAIDILTRKIQKTPNSMYLHVWLSNAELQMANYWLAKGNAQTAKVWADKAMVRSNKYGLEIRKLDIKKLLAKIGEGD